MKVQDRPTTIYVRDIDESTSKNFSRLKKRYASNSNTEVVKRLINDFEGKEEQTKEWNFKRLHERADKTPRHIYKARSRFSEVVLMLNTFCGLFSWILNPLSLSSEPRDLFRSVSTRPSGNCTVSSIRRTSCQAAPVLFCRCTHS